MYRVYSQPINLVSLADRRLCRREAGAHASCPVTVVAGDSAPQLAGRSWHYETRGGRPIYHPSAYSRHGWSNMVYCASTLAVEVGADWLAARSPEFAAAAEVGANI